MAIVLPIEPNGAHFAFKSNVEGVVLGFEFKWNDRDSLWRMSIFDGEGQPIRYGIAVVLNRPLLGGNFRPNGLPAGSWVAIDTSGQDKEATFDDLGSRVLVTFTPLAELAR